MTSQNDSNKSKVYFDHEKNCFCVETKRYITHNDFNGEQKEHLLGTEITEISCKTMSELIDKIPIVMLVNNIEHQSNDHIYKVISEIKKLSNTIKEWPQ